MSQLIRAPQYSSQPVLLPVRRQTTSADDFVTKNDSSPLEKQVAARTMSLDQVDDAALEKATNRILQLEQELQYVLDEASNAKNAAMKEGFEQGRKEGMESQVREQSETLKQLRGLVLSFQAELTEKRPDMENMAVEIAFAAVCKILGDAYKRDGIAFVIRQVMTGFDARDEILMRINPVDHRHLMQINLFVDGNSQIGPCRVLPDESVTLGGCVVDSSSGTLDAGLETQMSIFRETLLRVRHEAGHDV